MAGIERGVLVLVTLGVVCLVLERMDLGRVEEKAESGLTVPGVDAIVMLVVSTVREAAEERLRLFRDICLKTNFFSIKRKKKGAGDGDVGGVELCPVGAGGSRIGNLWNGGRAGEAMGLVAGGLVGGWVLNHVYQVYWNFNNAHHTHRRHFTREPPSSL